MNDKITELNLVKLFVHGAIMQLQLVLVEINISNRRSFLCSDIFSLSSLCRCNLNNTKGSYSSTFHVVLLTSCWFLLFQKVNSPKKHFQASEVKENILHCWTNSWTFSFDAKQVTNDTEACFYEQIWFFSWMHMNIQMKQFKLVETNDQEPTWSQQKTVSKQTWMLANTMFQKTWRTGVAGWETNKTLYKSQKGSNQTGLMVSERWWWE